MGNRARVAFWAGSCAKACCPRDAAVSLLPQHYSWNQGQSDLEISGLWRLPSFYKYPKGQLLHGTQSRDAVEGKGHTVATVSKLPTAWKCVILVPSLVLSCSGEGRFCENCLDSVYVALIPGSCVPGSDMLLNMVVGMLTHWQHERGERAKNWKEAYLSWRKI